MQVFTPRDYHGQPLCQAVVQDAAGVMYVANDTQVLRYDGVAWETIELPPECTGIREMALGPNGVVYVGGGSVLGYLDDRGTRTRFVSMVERLPESERNFPQIFTVIAQGDAVYFAHEQKIFRWSGGKFSIIPCATPVDSRGPRLHLVEGRLYLTAPGWPLSRVVGDRIEAVDDEPFFRENAIVSVESANRLPVFAGRPPSTTESGTEALLVLTAERGFFEWRDGKVTPVFAEMGRALAGKLVTRAQRMADGSLAVAFATASGNGGLRFDAHGQPEGPLDETIGLPSRGLRDFFVDREGGLWLGLESGLARLDWPSPVTVFGPASGLGLGIASDVTYHEGGLYVATIEGLHRLRPAAPGAGPRFERILNVPVYSLVSHPGGLLALGYTNMFLARGTEVVSLASVPASMATMRTSARDRSRVWVTSMHGLRSIYWTGSAWRDEGAMPGFDEHTRDVLEMPDGGLWLPTFNRGVYYLGLTDAPAGVRGTIAKIERRPGDIHHLPEGVALKFDREGLPVGGGGRADRKFYYFSPDSTHEAERRLPQPTVETTGAFWRSHLFRDGGAGSFWIAAANGVFRVDLAQGFSPVTPFAARLRPVGIREGETLLPERRDFNFEFFAPRYRPDSRVEFQTWLEGYEPGWSAWSPDRKRTFTHLPSGDFRFHVRARDEGGVVSAPASLGFFLAPLWWQTWWAALLYVAGGALAVWLLVRQSTELLRRKNERLEALIATRTQVLAQQNTELTRLHQLDLDEKISARLSAEKSRLEVLRYQLNPHFLFNSLLAIRGQIPAASMAARKSIDSLADFCRDTLHDRKPDERVSLGEEFAMLRSYLDIEQARLGELLAVAVRLAPEVEGELLPRLLLLPLVENAIKYGHATSEERLEISLAATRVQGMISIEVANTGHWVERPAAHGLTSFGIGLENLRERLQRCFPGAHTFERDSADGWVRVRLTVPCGSAPGPTGGVA